MPYKSKAQERYFHAAEERGEISKKTVDEFDKASKGKKLPERAKPKKSKSESREDDFRKHTEGRAKKRGE